ncbi:MAG TPA: N-acetyl-gamma-glutamyl-phosphate reductase, partial [Pseudolabrys sp.]|nr:N-acetyl-gamma-glutamyl-phosphate reductase [Pseudolabrys sp.]
MATKAKVGVLGASGYTGSELVRMLLRHPNVELTLLTAERSAGKAMRDVFPQFSPFDLPKLVALEGLDWAAAGLDVAFCALPHATTQKVLKSLLAKAPKTKVVDLSADFRLADKAAYAKWYGHEHHAPELQTEAV